MLKLYPLFRTVVAVFLCHSLSGFGYPRVLVLVVVNKALSRLVYLLALDFLALVLRELYLVGAVEVVEQASAAAALLSLLLLEREGLLPFFFASFARILSSLSGVK